MATAELITQRSFDYGDLPAADAKAMEKHADKVAGLHDKGRKSLVEIALSMGEELTKAQERLSKNGYGTFGKWVKERCGISYSAAAKSINAFATFGGNDSVTVTASFDVRSLFSLSAPSCPQEARDEALRLAEAGEAINGKRAKSLIEDAIGEEIGTVEDEGEPLSIDDCFVAIKANVTKWTEKLNTDDVSLISNYLRRLADQLER